MHQKAYAVRAIFVEIPEIQLQKLNISWMPKPTSPDSNTSFTVVDSGSVMDQICSSPQVRLTEFPVVHVNAGEREIIDNRRPVKYPATFDTDGTPTEYATTGVGRLIEVNLKSVTNNIVQFSYHIEDVGDPVWIPRKLGNSSRKIELPSFDSRSEDCSGITLQLNSWVISVGQIPESKDGTKWNLIRGIRVQESASP